MLFNSSFLRTFVHLIYALSFIQTPKSFCMTASIVTPARRAATGSTAPFRYCANPVRKPRPLKSNISGDRARLILTNATKWVNGTTLHYYFFNKKTDGAFVV